MARFKLRFKPRSHRRVPALKDSDYDHEISIVDRDDGASVGDQARQRQQQHHSRVDSADSAATAADVAREDTRTRLLATPEEGEGEGGEEGEGEGGEEGQGEGGEEQEDRAAASRWRRVNEDEQDEEQEAEQPRDATEDQQAAAPAEAAAAAAAAADPLPRLDERPRRRPTAPPPAPGRKSQLAERETAVDILYENERGGFLCGIPLFASKALGGLDPAPWTNVYHKTSPVDVRTGQPPDPSWEWAWPEWRINRRSGGTDEDGWEYSFAFSRRFSWHRPRWWFSSFVRRRAWVRKRVRRRAEDVAADPHMLRTDYFTVHPASHEQPQPQQPEAIGSSADGGGGGGGGRGVADITDMDTLLRALRLCRIDREKLEAASAYLGQASDLARLQDHMHEIMAVFVFQASRRLLLGRLMQTYDEALGTMTTRTDETREWRDQIGSLEAAIRHADEEVQRLAYWSDTKQMMMQSGGQWPPEPEGAGQPEPEPKPEEPGGWKGKEKGEGDSLGRGTV